MIGKFDLNLQSLTVPERKVATLSFQMYGLRVVSAVRHNGCGTTRCCSVRSHPVYHVHSYTAAPGDVKIFKKCYRELFNFHAIGNFGGGKHPSSARRWGTGEAFQAP